MTRRLDARRDYRAFPQSYTDFIQLFASHGSARIGPLPLRTCQAARRDLYRFKLFLINADEDDAHARRLAEHVSDMTLKIEQADDEGAFYLTARLNPVTAAMQTLSTDTGEPPPFDWKG